MDQMLEALRAMGFQPLVSTPPFDETAVNAIYRYIESEIPVMLALNFGSAGGHAITLVGHTYDRKKRASQKIKLVDSWPPLSFHRSSDFVPAFIAQDDSRGPFRMVEILDGDQLVRDKELRSQLKDIEKTSDPPQDAIYVVIDRYTSHPEVALLMALVVPLPNGVTLRGGAAEARTLNYLKNWWQRTVVEEIERKRGLLDRLAATIRRLTWRSDETIAVTRTFLRLSNDIKHHVVSASTHNPAIVERVGAHLFARWGWVTEIGEEGTWDATNELIGLIVQDSAGHPTSPEFFDFLYVHLPRDLIFFHPEPHRAPENMPVPDYRPLPTYDRALSE